MNRRTALQTTIGTAALAVAGCLSSEPDEVDFRIGSPWDINRDPLDGGSMVRRLGIAESLLSVDYEANPAPGIATEWDRPDDYHWEFSLREDVTFHDGDSLDVETAVESLERTFDAASFTDLPVESIEATDETTIEIATETPFSTLPAHLARSDACILNPATFDDEGSVSELISTGPFAVDEFRPGTSVTTVRHEEYYGEVPEIESVRCEIIEDDQTRRMNLENGDIDMARIMPLEMVDSLETNDDIELYMPEIPRIRFLTFDTESEPFDDADVRRAVNYAIDLEGLTESILAGVDEPAVGPFSEEITEWANPDLEGYEHDPERARDLLADAGWTAAGSDDVRTRDGEALEIEFVTFDSRSLPLIAEVLQDDLATVGFDVDVSTVEYNAMLDEVGQGSFDGYLTSWGTLQYPDPDRIAEMFHSTDATLFHGYENERVDELLEEARELTDREERAERYHEVQSIVRDEAPVAFLTNYTNVVATVPELEGYEPHPTEASYGLETVSMNGE
ncbi:ABC transporter substrate-binding protein [Halostagnicola bangensis]